MATGPSISPRVLPVERHDYGTVSGFPGGLAADESAAGKTAADEPAPDVVTGAAPPPAAAAPSAHHLMRSGDLSLLLARGTLIRTVDRVTALAIGMGGYVMSSSIGSDSRRRGRRASAAR